MDHFGYCLDHVLRMEGGFTNHPKDRGGPTKFGITKVTLGRFRSAIVTDKDVFDLTKEEASRIYRKLYWEVAGVYQIQMRRLALILFDQAVNSGPITAIRVLQIVLNRFFSPEKPLKVDGLLGPKTLEAVSASPKNLLCRRLMQEFQIRYVQICKSDITQLAFLEGWIRRTFAYQDLPPISKELGN